MSDEKVSPELEAAAKAFHSALDAWPGTSPLSHGYEASYVDENSYVVVEALLAAGWKPPADV